jgi:hypothetical protein
MGSPPEYKSPQQGKKLPWRLQFKNLPAVYSHLSLQRVRVMLLVDVETGLEN